VLSVTVFARPMTPRVEFELAAGSNKIDVIIGGKLVTSYLYGEQSGKPVLYPVRTVSGVGVNRGYPLVKIEGESTDHSQHVGIFFAYDAVNDDDFWDDNIEPPFIKHVKVTEMTPGNGKGTLSTVIHWIGSNGRPLLQEDRKMVFYAAGNEYAIDFSIDLTAQDTKVVFTDSKAGLFAIRVADWLGEELATKIGPGNEFPYSGSGEYLSSNGDRTEKNVWGKRAKWVRLEGKKDGKTVGIVIFNHPSSVNYPTYWMTRGYGLFAANPLGQHVFENIRHRYGCEKDRQRKIPQPFNLTLQPGESAHFRFLVVIYEGPRTAEQLEKRFEKFAK